MMFFQIENIDNFSDKELYEVFDRLSKSQQSYILKKATNKRKESLAVRALFERLLLKHFENISINQLDFYNKAPVIMAEENIYVSFSHSSNMVACAVSDKPVGIDIERIRDVNQRTVLKSCTTEEANFLLLGKKEDFFKIWTLKEAYIKAVGGGFADMKQKSFVKNGNIICKDGEFEIKQDQTYDYIWSLYF